MFADKNWSVDSVDRGRSAGHRAPPRRGSMDQKRRSSRISHIDALIYITQKCSRYENALTMSILNIRFLLKTRRELILYTASYCNDRESKQWHMQFFCAQRAAMCALSSVTWESLYHILSLV
ncbi:hypothetical protein J6590_009180 [Homalodisca vitripennis]|nr:hypothetical protein J6590_009180 [Homalodisca vitripennis]